MSEGDQRQDRGGWHTWTVLGPEDREGLGVSAHSVCCLLTPLPGLLGAAVQVPSAG